MTLPAAVRIACQNLARAGIGFRVLPDPTTRVERPPRPADTPPAAARPGQRRLPLDLDDLRRRPA